MEKLKKPFLFFLALLLMMGLIGFTTHVFADDEDTEIQTSTEVTGTAEENVDVDDSPAGDSQISDKSELTENTNSSESNEMDKMPQTDSTEELENTEELYAMDSDTNENEIATIAEKRNLFIDPNGGTYGGNSGVTTVDSEYGASYELNEIPVRDGYTFAGWRWDDPNDASNFRLFNPGDKIPSDLQDFTLHAMWVANGYHVTFEGNGADSGIMSDEAFTYDDNAKSLTANSFTREGYRFAGWNTKADGSGQSYTDTQAVKNLSEGGETILIDTESLQFNQWRVTEDGGAPDGSGIIKDNGLIKTNALTSGIAYSSIVEKAGWGGTFSSPLKRYTNDFKTYFQGKN